MEGVWGDVWGSFVTSKDDLLFIMGVEGAGGTAKELLLLKEGVDGELPDEGLGGFEAFLCTEGEEN